MAGHTNVSITLDTYSHITLRTGDVAGKRRDALREIEASGALNLNSGGCTLVVRLASHPKEATACWTGPSQDFVRT